MLFPRVHICLQMAAFLQPFPRLSFEYWQPRANPRGAVSPPYPANLFTNSLTFGEMGLISVLKVKSGKSSGVEIKKKKASYKTVTCQVFIPVYILLPL